MDLAEPSAAEPSVWRLPFCVADEDAPSYRMRTSGFHRLFQCLLPPRRIFQDGELVQGVGGAHTHQNELLYAYDFALAEGTPVLAAREGFVVATCDEFKSGGPRPELRPFANYLVIRHDDGLYSRYYHLAHASICVKVGERVEPGDVVAGSGNTGFSSGPHLHFDVVDVLPTETSVLQLMIEESEGRGRHKIVPLSSRKCTIAPSALADLSGPETASLAEPAGCQQSTAVVDEQPQSIAAAFCPKLPPANAPLCARLELGSPRDGSSDIDPACAGAIVMLYRCDQVDFFDKVKRAETAGALAAIIVNHKTSPPVQTMGWTGAVKAAAAEAEYASEVNFAERIGEAQGLNRSDLAPKIPSLMISLRDGRAIERMLLQGAPLWASISESPLCHRFEGGHRAARAALAADALALAANSSPSNLAADSSAKAASGLAGCIRQGQDGCTHVIAPAPLPYPWPLYVPVTQPVSFYRARDPFAKGAIEAYLPILGEVPPVEVQRATSLGLSARIGTQRNRLCNTNSNAERVSM